MQTQGAGRVSSHSAPLGWGRQPESVHACSLSLSLSACPLKPWCLSQDFFRELVCCHRHSQGLEAIRDVYSGILCEEEPRGSHVLESEAVPCWQALCEGRDGTASDFMSDFFIPLSSEG